VRRIENRSIFGCSKQIIHTVIRYFSFALKTARKQKPRFLIISFGIMRTQYIFDSENFNLIRVTTPTLQDFGILLQIFHFEFYKIENSWKTIIEKIHGISNNQEITILDLGANIGLSALYFSLTFPKATIVLVEISQRNITLAKENTLGRHCVYLYGAISNKKTRANLVDPGLGPDAFRVELSSDGSLDTFTVAEILNDFKSNPYLIKIDIEGSESMLFESHTEWIDKFPLIIIELHDWLLLNQSNSHNFLTQISKRNRNFIYRNENIFSF